MAGSDEKLLFSSYGGYVVMEKQQVYGWLIRYYLARMENIHRTNYS